MKIFNIFDSRGNKIGELSEFIPDDGLGWFASIFGLFMGVVAPIAVWPALFSASFSDISSTEEQICGVITLVSLVATWVVCVINLYKKEKFSFSEAWAGITGSITVVTGLTMWIAAGITDEFSIVLLILTLIIAFLLAAGSGFIGTLLVATARYVRKKRKTDASI